jgi:hypothetical protein
MRLWPYKRLPFLLRFCFVLKLRQLPGQKPVGQWLRSLLPPAIGLPWKNFLLR